MSWKVRRHGLLSALAGSPLVVRSGRSPQAAHGGPGNPQGFTIPRGYEAVDPRTARRVPLWQELNLTNPVFPGDPPFTFDLFTTIKDAGYRLERITSLGTHTGTHISAPAHVVEGALTLGELDEGWTLMPLAVIDVQEQVADGGGDFLIDVDRLREFERKYGEIPVGGCVLLLTGFSRSFTRQLMPGPTHDYFDPTPGFTAEAVSWLFESRRIAAVGSDTFGPDASSDPAFTATTTALQHGGITVENVGPELTRMRPFGDWVSINGGRPRFSGFQVGITGFTLP